MKRFAIRFNAPVVLSFAILSLLVLVLAALPTASSAYILAVRMGGDGRTVATIITVNVFVAMVTLPLWLGLAL